MDERTRAAFERLLRIARSDTGQSRRVANFVFAWWNADSLGGFDLADIFAVDREIGRDMATVVLALAEFSVAQYPEGYRAEIEELTVSGVRRSGRAPSRPLDQFGGELSALSIRGRSERRPA